MNTNKLKLALLVFCVVLLTPQSSDAAVSAVRVSDNTALFAIKFDFIAGKEAYRIPIGAKRGLEFASASNFVGYDIKSNSSSTATNIISSGLILSTKPTVDGLYYEIPAGERASFTFVSVVTVPETAPTTQYQAVLTHIPHFIGDNRVEVPEDRLEQFKSDLVSLNKEITGATFSLKIK